MARFRHACCGGFIVLAVAALLAWPTGVGAQGTNNSPVVQSTVVPAAQVFSCGAGASFLSVGISTHGNVSQFQSPAGKEHINVGGNASGYQICKSTGGAFSSSSDFGGFAEIGFGAAAVVQPNGPNTFPLEITRTTTDGQITMTRRITGNSFVAAGGLFDLNGDGVSCSTLAECGNCTNRTIHVLTRVTNNTPSVMTVRYIEGVDFDISGSFGNERASRTNHSVIAWEDLSDASADADAHGMLMQMLLPLATDTTSVDGTFHLVAPDADCTVAGIATPTGPSDTGQYVMQQRVIAPFSTDTGSLRVHLRRF